MMLNFVVPIALLAVCLFSMGCATIVNGTRQSLTVNSSPAEAIVIVDGKQVGMTPWIGKIDRQSRSNIMVQKPGYEAVTIDLRGEMSGWFLGNFICGGWLGSTTDLASGGIYVYAPDSYHVTLRPIAPAASSSLEPSAHAQRQDKASMSQIEEKKGKIKRFCLMYYKDIGQDIKQRKGDALESLRGLMNLSVPVEVFADNIKLDYVEATTPDDFAERMILKANF